MVQISYNFFFIKSILKKLKKNNNIYKVIKVIMTSNILIRYRNNTLFYGGVTCFIVCLFFIPLIFSVLNLLNLFTDNFDKYFLNNYFLKEKISNKINKINNDLKLLNNENLLGILNYSIIKDNDFAVISLRKITKKILLKIHPDKIRDKNLLEKY